VTGHGIQFLAMPNFAVNKSMNNNKDQISLRFVAAGNKLL